ncbi:hypothetical protein CU098_009266 [Rhizopus stolonifer]|uniref:Uncharacterized protein n=1 Tax=Rhizopus stolonifer TaxID=4846 RepID=A0A367KXQ8_RHIST|nr:hypothetical protein CU098_009266 [Rhizopus stolonifer]
MLSIAYFFSCQKLSLLSTEYRDDLTLQALYSIVKEQADTIVSSEKSTSDILLEVIKKRIRAYADDGALYKNTCKCLYSGRRDSIVEPMPQPLELSESATQLLNQTNVPTTDILRDEVSLPTQTRSTSSNTSRIQKQWIGNCVLRQEKMKAFLVPTTVWQA